MEVEYETFYSTFLVCGLTVTMFDANSKGLRSRLVEFM